MDKNKNRPELLAAGRKKLQQFRKKKDYKGRGSQGSSSKHTNKLEQHDADADTASTGVLASGSHSTDGVLASAVDCSPDTVGSSASPSTELALAAEEVGYREDYDHPIQNAESAGVRSSEPSLAPAAEENNDDIYNLSSSESSSQISSASVEQQQKIVEVWGGCRGEELLLPSSASLSQAREDVGMKGDDLMQSGPLCGTELAEDKQVETGGMNESAAETTFKDTCCDGDKIITADVASVSSAGTESNSYSISSPGEKLGMQNSSSSGRNDWKEVRQVHAEDMIHSSRSQVQYMPEDNFADKSESHKSPSQTSVKISDGGDVDTLSHNAHMTTTYAHSGTFSSFGQNSKFLDLLERVKEELIVTSFSKDIFNFQISEQNELQMKLDEVLVRNHTLVDELSHCRSELKDVSVANEELRNQLLAAEAEIQKLSSRASETENSFEKFHGDMFRLEKELDDCKHLVSVLEEENERLNGIITFENENKKKLAKEKELYIGENEKILSELSSFKSLKAALEVENSELMGSLSSIAEEKIKHEEEREHLFQVNGTLSVELANCKSLVATQQEEITNLINNLALLTEDKVRLEEDKNLLLHENEKMRSELLVLDERLSTEHEERVRFEDDLKDAIVQVKQLTEDNGFLSSSLDIHKFKVEELCGEILSLKTRSREDEDQAGNADSGLHHENKFQENDSYQTTFKKNLHGTSVLAVGKPFIVTEQENFDDSLGFVILGRHLEEADVILQKLEKEIKGLQSNSASFSRSGSKMDAPAVSKLIQAFESKVNVEENEVEDEIQLPDPYKLSNEFVDNLRALLRQVVIDAENASVLLKGERDHRKVAISTLSELTDQFEALKNHSNDLVIANIEHGVLFECLKHHVDDADGKIYELEILNESLRQQGVHHKSSNSELAERLCGYELKLTELECQLCDLHQSSNQMVSLICNQLDNLQDGAIKREIILEKDRHSFLLELAETIAKLDESVGKSDTSAIKFCTNDQFPSCLASSVTDAVKMIHDLRERLQATAADGEAFRMSYEEVNEKYDNLFRRTECSVDLLHKIFGELQKLYLASCESVGGSDMNMQIKMLGDPLDYSSFEAVIKPLEDFITQRLQLESVNNKLRLDLEHRTVELVDFSKRCLDSTGIEKLIKDVQSVLLLPEDTEGDCVQMPALYLQSIISLLIQKYKETELQLGLSREEYGSAMMKLTELQGSVHDLSTLILDHEGEIVILKESLSQAQEALMASRSELKDKLNELEQSEQRVSAIREKLSIAVTKGKGLIVQRDSLKQSLAQTSSELERCLQELQMKDNRLLETETKLKTYSEAGERVEALESELSYIRNSATALRESFLLKDSVLQRIDEILDALDLPENFHSRDIIEKVDWLAKSSTGKNLPQTDGDQRSSVTGGSGSDANFVTTDGWKDEMQTDANVGDDLRRKYEELQTKFYGLAEQNEMLEQSLMERNNLVQRWEELLEKIDTPSHLRSIEPEDKIEWLHRSLTEACHDRDSLHQRVNNLENHCGLLTADLDDSRKKISDIEAELHSVMLEREKLSEKLEIVYDHNEHLSFGTFENEVEIIILQNELSNMQDKIISTEHKIVKLEALVSNALRDMDMNDLVSGSSIEFLELMVMKLVQNYTASSLGNVELGRATNGPDAEEVVARSIDTQVGWQNEINYHKKELEYAVHQLMVVTKERDQYMGMHESLVVKVESLDRKKDELQELLHLEEQKLTSIREKLNVAVRKGKSLVQQRDSLKQAIEEMTTELDHLRSEMKSQENTLASYEQKFKNFSVYSGQVEALESENLSLRNQLTETERSLLEKEHILSSITNTLVHIEVNVDVNENDPIEKLKQVGKLCSDLREAVVFSEQESIKSRRAAELLLAELNEVQERNDAFQEELEKASDEIAVLTKERDLAETSKLEALSELENLSNVHLKEKKNQISQFMGLKSNLERQKEALREINYLLAYSLSKDLDAFYNLEAAIESCTEANGPADVKPSPSFVSGALKKDKGSFFALDSWFNSYSNSPVDENVSTDIHSLIAHNLEESLKEIGALKEMIDGHSVSFHKQSDSLSKVLGVLYSNVNSQKELVEALKWDVQQSESVAKDKEMEGDILCRNIAVLFEACISTIKEVDQRKGELMGNDLTSGNLGMDIISMTPDQLSRSGKTHLLSEESVRTIAERLLWAVREFLGLKAEMFDGSVKEMKVAISNLQKELQEKDIQKERICMDLVGQIKEAEASATRYSIDLQASKDQVHKLEKATEQMEIERKVLEQRLKEMQDGLSISDELRERVRSLTDSLAAKDQEIEALMRALDEEEVQMEGLTNKIEELEKFLKQKNQELESTETSRGKLMKKLSITVTKFDELHQLSESLLTEVEELRAQLQDRDDEISFLRQEVTRCTNDAIAVAQTSNRSTEDINEIITWFDTMETRVGLSHIVHDNQQNEVHKCKEVLKKKIASILKEIEDLQAASQRKDEMLLAEKNKVEELKCKELQLNLLEEVGDGNRASSAGPEIIESEPLINNWASSTSVIPQVRSLRKGNTDQVAIAIDMDHASSSNRLEDEDDDKVHGFKSLASSRIFPKFSRRATDMIDGLWVSCDRALMRQPALRLGMIFYWAILHALLVAFVV
ncbi:centrosome-associated protein CEP250-like isoform X2 [Cucurbita maxima]|uniref:Centrosome-associated protein CEP250-like isoform X2 n=1 Tax=Cucurbita maxima TaxID=3661 RepID=A0A6J1J174_CUCMA|nr:centrosome-associated protein CEP250-like isoform X2 [Cucurbita maxima]